MTWLQWNPATPTDVVFGTDLPKVVLNEAYAEVRNAPGDGDPVNGAQQPFQVNFWLVLLNPLNPAGSNDVNTGADRAAAQLEHSDPYGGGGSKYGAYRVVIAEQQAAFN